MAFTRPNMATENPDWATNEGSVIVDPGSSARATGWLPNQKPSYRWMNWIHRQTGKWINWLDQEVEAIKAGVSGTLTVEIVSSDVTGATNGTAIWSKVGVVAFLRLPQLYHASNSTTLRIQPKSPDVWPSAILGRDGYAPCIVVNNTYDQHGAIPVPTAASSVLQVISYKPTLVSSNLLMLSTYFDPTGDKGVRDQTISWII